jgi:hypothetical protein
MRLVKEVPHPRYLIQIHEYNAKYLLKVTLDAYEQVFKFDQREIHDLNQLDHLLTDEFYKNCLDRFLSMRNDFINFQKQIK